MDSMIALVCPESDLLTTCLHDPKVWKFCFTAVSDGMVGSNRT